MSAHEGEGVGSLTLYLRHVDRGKWSASRPNHFTPGVRVSGTHWRDGSSEHRTPSRRFGEENILLSLLLGIEPRFLSRKDCRLIKTPSALTRAIYTLLYVPGWLIFHTCRSKSLKTDIHVNDNPTFSYPPKKKEVRKGTLFQYGMSFSRHTGPFVRVHTPDLSVPDMNVRTLD